MTQIVTWTTSADRSYTQAAIGEFLASADLRLVAQAAARGATVVTRERPEPQSKKRVKIPDACAAHGVPWTDPFTTYRRLGLRLVSEEAETQS
jgi:hypothetical protein